MLGKRKRDTQIVSKTKDVASADNTSPSVNSDAGDVFRRHFEAMFAPLPEPTPEKVLESDQEESEGASEVSEWSGLSQFDNDLPVVEVVDYGTAQNEHDVDEFHRARQKAFMVRLSYLMFVFDTMLTWFYLHSQVDLHAKLTS